MHLLKGLLFYLLLALAWQVQAASVVVSNLLVRQRSPLNGLVAIECDIAYEDANADIEVSVVATNMETEVALPVRTIHVADGEGLVIKAGHRHFIWDVGADLADKVKIENIVLNVTAAVSLGGVQLWGNGPYWAECNVGAAKPEEHGYYFWWGDTVGYKRAGSSWNAVDGSLTGFSFSSGNCPTYGKDNSELQSLGYIDDSGNLMAAHDAATVHLGKPWRMPTDEEWRALISNCDTTWTTLNGMIGRLVRGRGAYASKSIFLPATGYGYATSLFFSTRSYGCYWSSSSYPGYSYLAWGLFFYSGDFYRSYSSRCYGQFVRPLRVFAQ